MTPPEESYTRRVCAVLLADVSGYSALMGEDDEGAAHAVDSLRVLVRGIVAEHSGSTEAVAGGAFFATFDSVVAAVSAAVEIQRQIAAQEFAGRQLRIRIGVHYGDVLLRESGAHGDAINVAARLQSIARPGTICISDGVYRQVRRRFEQIRSRPVLTERILDAAKNTRPRAMKDKAAPHALETPATMNLAPRRDPPQKRRAPSRSGAGGAAVSIDGHRIAVTAPDDFWP